jgi:RHS repeat-associated protein
VATNAGFDFKGNLVSSSRQLVQDYKTVPNWAGNPALETEIFRSSTHYDALNRPVQLVAPHSDQANTKLNVMRPGYNEANLLERMDVWLGEAAEPTTLLEPQSANFHAVMNIDRDAKGQRRLIEYGNGARTEYSYDPLTFRLVHLRTTRGGAVLQDLFYTYDPVGNITRIRDEAQQTNYFKNQVVLPHCDYRYDPIYRLVEAMGREHIGQAGQPETSWDDEFRVNLPHPGDGQAMRNYTEQYVYDAVGNFEKLIHQAANGSWTRAYAYNEGSLVEPGKPSNRLSSTTVGTKTEPYTYDAHGNMTSMPHLTLMQWNYKDELGVTSRQAMNATLPPTQVPETTFYVYDASGERIRKVTERQNGTRKDERIYLGGFEIYREFKGVGNDIKLERETLHVMDDQQRIALVETKTVTNPDDESPPQLIRFQFGNHLGSASLELDDKGNAISYEEYYPYGSSAYQAVDKGVKATAKRYRYTGMERDEETGLNYHSARYCATWLGRWTSCDPIGIGDGVNVYKFVNNNPIKLLDNEGTQCNSATHCCLDPNSDYDSSDVIFNPNDVVYQIGETQRPGDVAQWWAQGPRSNRNDWAHPLSEMEQGYIQSMRDGSVPESIRMRAPVDPTHLTDEERSAAERLFGNTGADYERYSNYENRRRIVANHVYTHPATVALELGIYRLFRDVNPVHFALERGWQMGSGREMFTREPVSRLGAATEFFTALALSYGISRGLRALRYSPTGSGSVVGSIGDDANFAQTTYKNAFTNEPGAGFRGMTVDQVADALRRGIMHPRMVPVDYILRDGNTLILNTRSAQALTQAGMPRSQWAGINRTGNTAFEARLTGQLRRNNLTSVGTPTVRRSGTPRTR